MSSGFVAEPSAAKPDRRRSSKKDMPLSCQGCRLRKVKCNFEHPCSSCVKLGVECIQVSSDMRKKRPPANYVLTLEKRIDAFQKFLGSVQRLGSPEAQAQYLAANQAVVDSLMRPRDGEAPKSAVARSESPVWANGVPPPYLEPPTSKLRSVYGPTSVYESDVVEQKLQSALQKKDARSVATVRALSQDPDVLHCLKLFFTWQYPSHNVFVFREAFFTDFANPKPNMLYCSPELVLSLCCLGSRMSDVDTIYSRSLSYYNEAKCLLLSNLEYPSIASVQSFLLLAFYDICNGHNSTGWMLSGNAMRMGFDLGFQLNPEVWFLKQQRDVNDLDVSIRSRIYWGCFMADHFISLVLGKPSLLKLSEASIPETEDLPELDWINDYKYIPENVTNISDPLKNIINLINISDNMLTDVFTKSENYDTQESHSHDDYDLSSRLSKLFEYNAQILEWKNNLPQDLNWERETLRSTSEDPTISVVVYYYYILVLCLNRPFVGIARNGREKTHLSPSVVCSNAIEDLYVAIHQFEQVHGLRRASIFIVYCSILSISVILLTSTTQLTTHKKTRLQYFLEVLRGCSSTWGLAEKSYKMIKCKLQIQFVDDPDFKAVAPDVKVKKPRDPPVKPLETVSAPVEVKTEEVPGPAQTQDTVMAQNSSLDSAVDERIPLNGNLDLTVEDLGQLPYTDPSGTELFGGPPMFMTSDLVNEDWEALFPDSILSQSFGHKQ